MPCWTAMAWSAAWTKTPHGPTGRRCDGELCPTICGTPITRASPFSATGAGAVPSRHRSRLALCTAVEALETTSEELPSRPLSGCLPNVDCLSLMAPTRVSRLPARMPCSTSRSFRSGGSGSAFRSAFLFSGRWRSLGGCTVNRSCRLGSPTATVVPRVYVKTAGPFLRVVPASLIRVNVWKLNTVQK